LLKIAPNLARMALRENLELAFVFWAIARQQAIESNLSSHYSKKDFKSLLAQNGLTYNRRHFLRIIQQGTGIFWRIGQAKIYLVSFEKVASYFEQFRKPCDNSFRDSNLFIQIQLSKSIEAIRAEIYFAWFAQFPEKIISRQTLTDLFGLSATQQRAYEKLLGSRLLVKTNYAHIDAENFAESPQNLPEYHFEIDYEREITRGEDIDSDYVGRFERVNAIQYQLPNTFFARPTSGDFIAASEASNRAKRAISKLFRPVSSLNPLKRSYWTKRSQFERLANGDSFLRVAWQGKKSLWIVGHYS